MTSHEVFIARDLRVRFDRRATNGLDLPSHPIGGSTAELIFYAFEIVPKNG